MLFDGLMLNLCLNGIYIESYRIQCEFHSMTDSTIKPSKRIQSEFHSKTDSTIKPTNGIQQTDLTLKPTN